MIITEKHHATVTNTADPIQRGRIKVACVALLGDETTELPMWVEPIYEWGWFTIPDVGEIVEIEVAVGADDDEQRGQISIGQPNIRYRSRVWGGLETDGARAIPDDFLTNYGKRRGFATPGGHVLMFDDTPGKEKVSLTWHSKDDKYSYFSFDETGSVILSNKNGSLIYLNAEDGETSWIDEHGNSFSTSVEGMKLIDKFSNIIETKDGLVQILSQSAIAVSAKNVVVDAGSIELASNALEPAVDPAVLGAKWMALFAAHTHPTGVGPSGPPIPTGTEALVLSTKVKLG
jgi:hypothetical protein